MLRKNRAEASATLRREPEISHASIFLHATLCHSPERNENIHKELMQDIRSLSGIRTK